MRERSPGSIRGGAGRQQITFECKGDGDGGVVNERTSRGARRGKGDAPDSIVIQTKRGYDKGALGHG